MNDGGQSAIAAGDEVVSVASFSRGNSISIAAGSGGYT